VSRRTVAALVAVLALAAPGSALAANRFASPTDIGTGDCLSEANSCDLPTAVSGAGAGDDISVRGDMGEYDLSAQLTNANAIHVHGTHGRPALIFNSERLTLQTGSSAENLYVELGGAFGDVQLSGSTGNNLIVQDTGNDHAIFMEDSTLTNSAAWSPAGTGSAIELDSNNTLRNVTSYAPAAGAIAIIALGRSPESSGPVTDTFVNVIARGGTGGAGIRAREEDGIDLTANVDHSNYSSADTTGTVDGTKTHLNLDASNQTAAPLFADATGGDFHQLGGSPTIDRGVNDAANGTADFDGDTRTLNGITDIGADESLPGVSPAPNPKPKPPACAYGNPNCATTCTNLTTLLVTCPDLSGAAGLCPGELFPQCVHPVVPRTSCRRTGGLVECTPTTPGERPAAGSCASMGQALPECNVPTRLRATRASSTSIPSRDRFASAARTTARSATARRRAPRSLRRATSPLR
jgi:hypothetical protein